MARLKSADAIERAAREVFAKGLHNMPVGDERRIAIREIEARHRVSILVETGHCVSVWTPRSAIRTYMV